MVVGIASDAHLHVGRLLAFGAQAREQGAEQLWFLGDVVDSLLGAPAAALADAVAAAVETCDLVLGGNHELWCLQRGLLDPETAGVVSAWAPLERPVDGVLAVHASPRDPFMEFVQEPAHAAQVLHDAGPGTWLTAHGHTHRRRLWTAADAWPHAASAPTRGTVEAGERPVVACPGALTGARPSWLLVDLAERRLRWVPLRA